MSFSPFSDETVEQLAHVVLPDHTYLERYEDASAAPGLTRAVIGVRKPVVTPLHDTRATGDVILDIASRLGKSVAASMPWSSFRDAIDARFLGLHDANRGSVRASSERDFLAKLYEAAVWSDSAAPPPKSVKFNLPTTWQQPDWRGDESAYPLRLVLYRALGHSDGSGANQAWLHQLRTRPGARPWEHVALIHPSSAGGLVDGAVVTIASEWGQVEMPIQFERRMVPGCVAISLGRGHTAYGRFAKGVGVNALVLAAPGPAPITGASVLCGTRVRLSSGGKNG